MQVGLTYRKKRRNEAAYTFMDVLVGIVLLGMMMASVAPFFSFAFQLLPDEWGRRNDNLSMVLLLRDLRQIAENMHMPYWSSGNVIRWEGNHILLAGDEGETTIARDGEYWTISSGGIKRRYRAGNPVSINLAYSKTKYPSGLLVAVDEFEYRIPFSSRILESPLP